jgi:hypothetical protein
MGNTMTDEDVNFAEWLQRHPELATALAAGDKAAIEEIFASPDARRALDEATAGGVIALQPDPQSGCLRLLSRAELLALVRPH